MDTRRDFLKKAILLSGATGMHTVFPASIQRAFAINPEPGSTYLDAEHVVILMQENRSFDHCFGALQGVRGFNDPRTVTLPNGNLAWLQTDGNGDTYVPFHFNIRDTKATWMGSLPHSRSSQVDAFNEGKHDKWLTAKRSGHDKYKDMPLTMGYYTREDLPFHYALADAFTICDQHFSSAMTSTWPNRLYMWGGTIREQNHGKAKAYIRNDIPYGEARWKTFPERLQEHNISWKVYQNDLACGGGFEGEQRAWVANYICNLLEWLSQYHVRFSDRYVQSLKDQVETLSKDIPNLENQLIHGAASKNEAFKKIIKEKISRKKAVLDTARKELVKWSRENFDKLSACQKELYHRAFTTNAGDPAYRELATLTFHEGGKERSLLIPKGDSFYQFRKDVNTGRLPTVSWLVAPKNFSDHPSAPWYGAWYTSEILDILTRNPEVWKKTIFILTYDENDGYFDHIPPFVSPDPRRHDTGKCSPGADISSGGEYIRREQEIKEGVSGKAARSGPIGLGFRVPMIIASPWSRGGKVCSQVFDHTSSLQFLEDFLNHKYHKNIKDDNITPWRRAVCGDLTAAFHTYKEKEQLPFLKKDPFIEKIYNARFKELPANYKKLTAANIASVNREAASSRLMPRQEPGRRTSCALPYQLYADGGLSDDKKSFGIVMRSGKEVFGRRSAGSPFYVYAPGKYRTAGEGEQEAVFEAACNRHYAVAAGEQLTDDWLLENFENKAYHLRLYGPNGFFREFAGDTGDPLLKLSFDYEGMAAAGSKLTGNLALGIKNLSPAQTYRCNITDKAYGNKPVSRTIAPGKETSVILNLEKSTGWYDFIISIKGHARFLRRYAGHVETGKEGYTDPAMA